MKSRPKKKVNKKVTAKICEAARKVGCSNQLVTARKVKNKLTYDISIRSIQRTLRVNNFKYQSVEKYMPLTKKHMEDTHGKNGFHCKDGPDNEISWFDKAGSDNKINY